VIERPPLPPGPFLVVGLARSGVAAALALRARGGEVVACDAAPVSDDTRAELAAAGVPVHAPTEAVELVARASTVVKSPGVPQQAAVVAAARREGLRVIGELEIGWRLLTNEFIAVTGSNGKTTTAEWIGHVHRAANVEVVVAGNVGTALTTLPGVLAPEAVVVCEASSFQLEDTEAFAPEAAVLLNLAEDHLDRHGSFDAYRAAKLRVFAAQPPSAIAVAPSDLVTLVTGEAQRITFGRGGDLEHRDGDLEHRGGDLEHRGGDLEHRDGRLYWRQDLLMDATEIRLRGTHNRENAMATAAVCLARGIPQDAVREGLTTFTGVPHRMEEIARIDGVLYVNDSKATNVASAVVAIESFPAHSVHAILGGSAKGSDYAPLAQPLAEHAKAAYVIGETAGEIREVAEQAGVEVHDCGDLEHALDAARTAARAGDTVLLSPACASYDQYRSFEERGEHFKALVNAGG
jgi:UDP-N-acetylmuramoylalanine--D-glutamate ligase